MIWLFLASCADKEVEEVVPCTKLPWYQDVDGDGFGDPFVQTMSCTAEQGYVDNNLDCDDGNPVAFPDAQWFRDADTDGFGDPNTELRVCIPPIGYVQNSDDCDDFDASKNPDGLWYFDGDGDGFGGLEAIASCDAIEGTVSNNLDCNDDDIFIHPDGIEVCDDIDNDCDNLIDDDDGDLDTFTAVPKFFDDDGDGFGTSEILGYYCPSYPFGALVSGDCDDENSSIHPLAIDLYDDIDSDCDGVAQTMDAYRFTQGWSSPIGSGFGIKTDIAYIGEDPTLPAMVFSLHGYNSLSGAVFYVPADTPIEDFSEITDVGELWTSGVEQERLGRSLVFAGDMDGDGVEDVLAGGAFDVEPRAGIVYLISTDLEAGDLNDATHFTGLDASYFGNDVLALGDIDEDGFDDALIAARADDSTGSNRGAIHLLSGGEEPSITHTIHGLSNGFQLGFDLKNINDFDGDGISEIAITSIQSDYLANNAGTTFLIPKNMFTDEALDITTVTQFHGTQTNEHTGYAVTDAGDFNGDGYIDLLIGSPDYDIVAENEGRAFVVYGGTTDSDLSNAPHIFYGKGDDDNAGEYVHRLGDINGDGHSDIAIIAHKNDDNGSNSGVVYGILGGMEEGSVDLDTGSSFVLYGATSNDQLGRGINPVGDINQDGYDDFWLTSSSHGYGKAYIMYGSP